MRYEDEPWIKVYTRDTPDYVSLSWQARGLLLELARKVDTAGVLTLGRRGLEAISIVLRAPWSELEPFIVELVNDRRVIFNVEENAIILPEHVEMQTSRQSDRARKQRSRESERIRITGKTADVTLGHTPSHEVTDSPGESHEVTGCHLKKRREEIRKEEREIPPPDSVTPVQASERPADSVLGGFDLAALEDGIRQVNGSASLSASYSETARWSQVLAKVVPKSTTDRAAWLREAGAKWAKWCAAKGVSPGLFKFNDWVNDGMRAEPPRPAGFTKPEPPPPQYAAPRRDLAREAAELLKAQETRKAAHQ